METTDIIPYFEVLLLTALAIIGTLKAWIGLLVSVWNREFGGHIIYAGTFLGTGSGVLAALLLLCS